MQESKNATLLVLSGKPLSEAAQAALVSSATALDHEEEPAFAVTAEYDAEALAVLIHKVDPWSVVAMDDEAIVALQSAFPQEAQSLAPDAPVIVRGYQLVAVPGFEECLEDLPAKRVAWGRLKSAQHPGAPL